MYQRAFSAPRSFHHTADGIRHSGGNRGWSRAQRGRDAAVGVEAPEFTVEEVAMERVWPEVQDMNALRERAQALGISGADSMGREELTRAVGAAQREAEATAERSGRD